MYPTVFGDGLINEFHERTVTVKSVSFLPPFEFI